VSERAEARQHATLALVQDLSGEAALLGEFGDLSLLQEEGAEQR